jgi:hypothetical protein
VRGSESRINRISCYGKQTNLPGFNINPAKLSLDFRNFAGSLSVTLRKSASPLGARIALTTISNIVNHGQPSWGGEEYGSPKQHGYSYRFEKVLSLRIGFVLPRAALFQRSVRPSDEWKRFHQQALVLQETGDYMRATEMAQKALEFS